MIKRHKLIIGIIFTLDNQLQNKYNQISRLVLYAFALIYKAISLHTYVLS